MKIIVTGGAGFIGSAVCRYYIGKTDVEIVNIDKLTYAANLNSLDPIKDDQRYTFVKADICNRAAMAEIFAEHRPDGIMHLAAESHVDRSITGAGDFIHSNIVGTYTLLDAARNYWMDLRDGRKQDFRFLQVSTDEVYGSLGADGLFHETTAYDPSSPAIVIRYRPYSDFSNLFARSINSSRPIYPILKATSSGQAMRKPCLCSRVRT